VNRLRYEPGTSQIKVYSITTTPSCTHVVPWHWGGFNVKFHFPLDNDENAMVTMVSIISKIMQLDFKFRSTPTISHTNEHILKLLGTFV